ncbi:MAG: adenylyltransferase/cytidyltransferase family protein [Methanogenium sp.]|jgi:FAD synthetase
MKRKVLVGGCFNEIHEGHIHFLSEAKKKGDYLIVVLTNDVNNKKEYAVDFRKRKQNLEKLNIANKIIEGDKHNFEKVIYKFLPATIVLGYDQKLPKNVKFYGKVERIKRFKNYSTKNMAKRKLNKSDLGSHCLIKNVSLVKSDDMPIDPYIWTIISLKTINKKQYVELVSSWTSTNIWKVEAKDIIIH